jgi:hypothetical protein
MFSKCANPEDGGGVKRIIMGLDRNTRYASHSPPFSYSALPDVDFFFFFPHSGHRVVFVL